VLPEDFFEQRHKLIGDRLDQFALENLAVSFILLVSRIASSNNLRGVFAFIRMVYHLLRVRWVICAAQAPFSKAISACWRVGLLSRTWSGIGCSHARNMVFIHFSSEFLGQTHFMDEMIRSIQAADNFCGSLDCQPGARKDGYFLFFDRNSCGDARH